MQTLAKKRNYKIRYDRILGAFAIIIIIIILLITGCSKRNKTKKENTNTTENISFSIDDADVNQAYMNVSIETRKLHAGNLILVNEKNPCLFDTQAVEDGTSTEINFVTIKSMLDAKNTSVKPYTASDWEVGLDRETAVAMDNWFTAFYQETGLNDLRMIGGYKPESADLDFQTGRTITIGIFPEIGSSYAYKPEGNYAWLQEHAQEYGFILRYPENKEIYFDETITERRTATFRYVGIPSAIYMTQKNICLEEFLEEIKEYTLENMLMITNADKTYHMYYVPANMNDAVTTFRIPDDRIYYEVSGNNIDGFIVTIFQ